MSDIAKLQIEIETLIRAGSGGRAARLIKSVRPRHIPRKFALPFANLARRCGLFANGLRILTPVIYPAKGGSPPSPQELAEYSVLLQKIGAVEESWLTLSKINSTQVPEVRLYRAFYHFHRWDSAAAVPELEDYLNSELAPYPAIVGRVNLCLALVGARRFEEAMENLALVQEQAAKLNAGRILANSYELSAQVHLQREDFKSARMALAEANRIFRAEALPDAFFVRKWKLIVDSLESGRIDGLMEIRKEAEMAGDWESIRECDFQRLRVKFDESVFRRLYFGTPYPAYRERIVSQFRYQPIRGSAVHGEDVKELFNPGTGEFNGHQAITPGTKTHQLIKILLRDLYRPLRIGGIFAELFHGEFFDIYSSPNRVQQSIARARKHLAADLPKFRIHEDKGNYFLQAEKGIGILLEEKFELTDSRHATLEKVRAAFMLHESFSCEEGSRLLNVSKPTFRRWAAWAVAENHLVKFGAGPSTHYWFSPLKKASSF